MFALRKFILLSIVFVALAENALAHPFATVVSFGDSLSDTTNNPANGDYWEGRWSNGPLWDEYLAGDLGATLYDYAFAGSVTADLPGQVSAAKAAAWDETNTLFTVWSGANDFIDNAQANGTSYSSWEATAAAAVSNIKRAVSMLSEGGARYVVVLNLPDLSQLPAVETNAELAADRSLIRGFAAGFNAGARICPLQRGEPEPKSAPHLPRRFYTPGQVYRESRHLRFYSGDQGCPGCAGRSHL